MGRAAPAESYFTAEAAVVAPASPDFAAAPAQLSLSLASGTAHVEGTGRLTLAANPAIELMIRILYEFGLRRSSERIFAGRPDRIQEWMVARDRLAAAIRDGDPDMPLRVFTLCTAKTNTHKISAQHGIAPSNNHV